MSNALQRLNPKYRLTTRQFGDVKSQMWKLGYRNGVSEADVYTFCAVGAKNYEAMVNTVFDYTCLEADYLKMERAGEGFIKMNIINRRMMLERIVEQFSSLINMGKFEFVPVSTRDMKQQIYKKYSGQKTQHTIDCVFEEDKPYQDKIPPKPKKPRDDGSDDGEEWKRA